jgi:hypothetical protein
MNLPPLSAMGQSQLSEPQQLLMRHMQTQPMSSPVAFGSDMLATALMKYGGSNQQAQNQGLVGKLLDKLLYPNGIGASQSSI